MPPSHDELMRRGLLLSCLAITACQRCSNGDSTTPHVATEDANVSTHDAFRVPGLDALAHKPILVLDESDAWTGSPELLPAVTIYEDGLAITAEWGDAGANLVCGRVEQPAALARSIYLQLVDLAPRIEISRASDQPEVTIAARVGDAWRAVNVVGFRRSGAIDGPTADPPSEFVGAHRKLIGAELRDRRPFVPEVFVVRLTDDSVPTVDASAWPADVPPPPAELVPDTRFLGNPRTYALRGDAGATLEALARERKGHGVRMPSGERVSLAVHASIPSGDYVEMLLSCRGWEREPFHDCVRKLPGRP